MFDDIFQRLVIDFYTFRPYLHLSDGDFAHPARALLHIGPLKRSSTVLCLLRSSSFSPLISIPYLYIFLFNWLSPCCLGPSSFPLSLWDSAYCNVNRNDYCDLASGCDQSFPSMILHLLLECHIFFDLMNGPLALDCLFLRSFILPPSLHTLTPKYVNSATSSISISLTTILSWFHALILGTSVFSVVILSPTRLASPFSFVVLSCICCLVEEIRAISNTARFPNVQFANVLRRFANMFRRFANVVKSFH